MAKLSFRKPHHGWLPVHLVLGADELEFEASDVPNNPVQDLADALHLAARDLPASVWWNLEPAAYGFHFSPSGPGLHLCVSFSEQGHPSARQSLLEATGSKQDLLLPCWRALRPFEAWQAVEPHWPPVRFGSLQALGKLLRG